MYYFKPCGKNHFTYTSYLHKVFKRRKDWRRTKNKREAHYTGCPSDKKRLSDPYEEWGFFNKKLYLVDKLKGADYYPKTLIINDKGLRGELPKDGRWFLKKNVSYGGKDVVLLGNIKNYKKRCAKNTRYILQQEIVPDLYNGHKYDLRMYVVMVRAKGRKWLFLYDDGYVRLALKKYKNSGINKEANLTNITPWLQSKKKLNLFCIKKLDNYNEFFPKIEKMIMPDLFKRIKSDFFKPKVPGFTLFGIDIIISETGDPYLLEINNRIGFAPSLLSKKVMKLHMTMLNSMVDAVFIPIIEKRKFRTHRGWHLIE